MYDKNHPECLTLQAQHPSLCLLSLVSQMTDIQKRTVRMETRMVALMEILGYTAKGKLRADAEAPPQAALFN
jgi:hypothetical protein